MHKEKVLVILGPTASGKSALGVRLARRFGGEIISADSRQVYKGLDLGTGKITKKEMRGIPHHLLDVASSKRKFSASNFVKKARTAHSNILQNMRVSIVVGGTGYYIDSFVGRILVPDVPPDRALRKKLESQSTEKLFAMLQKRDAERAATIEPHHKRRLIRALEIARALGKNPTPAVSSPYDVLWIGIAPTLPELEEKISKRLRARLKAGMLKEARLLRERGLSLKRMGELGLEYRSQARHLKGLITKEEMISELERDIRRYAKKQLAYWKRNTHIEWFRPNEAARIEKRVRDWLSR